MRYRRSSRGLAVSTQRGAVSAGALVLGCGLLLQPHLGATSDEAFRWCSPHVVVEYFDNFGTPFGETLRQHRTMELVGHAGRVMESYVADVVKRSGRELPGPMRVTFVPAHSDPPEERAIDRITVRGLAMDPAVAGLNRFLTAQLAPPADALAADFRTLEKRYRDNYGPVLSPDGSRLVFRSWREGALVLVLYDRKAGSYRELTARPGSASGVVWSPDGKRLACETEDALHVIQVETLAVEASIKGTTGGLVWSPMGDVLAVETVDDAVDARTIFLVKAGSAPAKIELPPDGEGGTWFYYWPVAFSDDGRYLVVSPRFAEGPTLAIDTGTMARTDMALPRGQVEAVFWTDRNAYLAQVRTPGGVLVYRGQIAPAKATRSFELPAAGGLYAVSRDGRKALYKAEHTLGIQTELGDQPYYREEWCELGPRVIVSLQGDYSGDWNLVPGMDGSPPAPRFLYLQAVTAGLEEHDALVKAGLLPSDERWAIFRAGDDWLCFYPLASASARKTASLLMARDSYVDAAVSPAGEAVFVRAPEGGCYRLYDARGQEIVVAK